MTAVDVVRRYAAMPVPRYTSYPTAAEFTAAVGPEDHAMWLRRLDPRESVSLYLHVPYCRTLCHYCGCHTKMAVRDHVIRTYREALEAEIGLVAGRLPGRIRAARLAWGGGTPSILGVEGWASVLAVLRRHFDVEPGHEHAIELDPRHVDMELAQSLAEARVNRVSLGVQDLDPRVQEAIGRIQPVETVRRAVDLLRVAGMNSINFDLIYGLPHQTVESIRATCAAVAAMSPDRIAFYGYAHLPGRRANQRLIDAAALPGVTERYEQARAIGEFFENQGFVPVGIDHFAAPHDRLARAAQGGALHRNFQGYTDDDRPILIGFGASAVSRLPDGFVQNIADNPRYCRSIAAGDLATARGWGFCEDDRARARIIEALMCNFQVDLAAADPGHDYADELALLRPLAADGMLEIKGGTIRMTGRGRQIVRVVAAVFDRFRAQEETGFSLAV
jgi:oxygen-independent coproporphyrinogen-3 oxidase